MTKIMLVEDDKSLREIYGVRLLAEGYDIVSAGDGEEALAMAIKERPQLIISDVMMPKISGFDMLDILRSTTETKNIRVIMMTALSSDEQRERGEQLGADKYLVKSQVGIEDVVKAVHEVLQDKPGAAAAPQAPPQSSGGMVQAPAQASTPTFNTSVSTVASPPASSTIPEPTAPFTGQRPGSLGDRVIQPLKNNPRVSSVDVGDLMDKEFAANIQNVEDTPDPNAPAEPVAPLTAPAAAAPTPRAQPVVTMDPPSAPQPAADDASDLAALASSAPTPPAPPIPTTIPVTSPPADTASPTTPPVAANVPPATQPAPPAAPMPVSSDRTTQPVPPPDRTPPTIPSYE